MKLINKGKRDLTYNIVKITILYTTTSKLYSSTSLRASK